MNAQKLSLTSVSGRNSTKPNIDIAIEFSLESQQPHTPHRDAGLYVVAEVIFKRALV